MKIENWKLKINAGFTLVELLIVIALIGVLAVALVATLNPIEQINKARDARYKNDAAELLAAIERYYATQQFFPWSDNVWGTGNGASTSSALGLTAKMSGVGICGGGATYDAIVDDCDDTAGQLIETDELKESFAKKDQFEEDANMTDIDRLYLYRPAQSSSVWVCFIPKANSNRQTTSPLINLDISAADGVPGSYGDATDVEIEAATWEDRTDSYFFCVPE